MTKLHEILAVEGDKEGHFKKAVPEMLNLFKNKTYQFQGSVRELKMIGEETPEKAEAERAESESVKLMTTVPAELWYLTATAADYFDVVYQKDLSNQRAVADLIVDGITLAEKVPATTLLGLEAKLKFLRQVYDEIPTLQPGAHWKLDPEQGKYIYRDEVQEVRAKTKKSFDFKILVPATDKHPAQVEKWDVTENVGFFTKTRWSGCLSVADKSALLARFDKLLLAVKQARQRANEVEVPAGKIGVPLFAWLHADLI